MSDYKRYYVDVDEAIIDKETRRQYETWNIIDIEAICDKLNDYDKENKESRPIKRFAERHGINVFKIDEAFRKCWNDNANLFDENRKLKQIIDEADDLIKSHLTAHYNRKWENYCKNNGLNLKELDTYETITKRH